MTRKQWTKEEEKELSQYISNGLSHKEISEIFCVSIASITNKCRRLKIISSVYWTKKDEDLLIKYIKEGLLFEEISILLDKPKGSITCKSHKLHLDYSNHNIKLCNICSHKIGSASKICIYCGYRFDKNWRSFAEKFPELLKEWDYDKNNVDPNNVTTGYKNKIYWIGKCGHKWEAIIGNRTRGASCPYCSGHKILKGFNDIWTTHPEICEELVDRNDGYKVSKGSEIKLQWKCRKCNNLFILDPVSRILQKQGCKKCNRSKNEIFIENLLQRYNIKYDPQKTFENCKSLYKLRFDFYLPEYNILIEYQGEQHYPHHNKINKNINRFSDKRNKETLLHDKIKKNFCKKENIQLVEIPYWEKNNIEQILHTILNIKE